MASQQTQGGAQMFGYHFGAATEDMGFHPDESGPPTGPSILSQEDAHRMGDFFAHTPFWPEGNAQTETAGDGPAQAFGYYSVPEVHDVSIQSPFAQNSLSPLTFMNHSQADVISNMGPPLSAGIHSNDLFGTAAAHIPLHISSASQHMSMSSVTAADHIGLPSLGREDSTSEQSPLSNAITPSPTVAAGPNAFLHRASAPGQMQSRHSMYDMPVSPGSRMQSVSNESGRYRAPVQFGTDDRFRPNGFSGPEAIELNRDYNRKISDTMKYFQSPNNESPQSSSPTSRRPLHNALQSGNLEGESIQNGSGHIDSERSVKRPKIDSFSNPSHPAQPGTDEDSRKKSKGTIPAAPNSGARRKKSTHASSRQNLSDEQKRSNHIKSEQKRRDTIKQGFSDLHLLVPELQKSSHSKAEQLKATVIWLRSLLEGNEELRVKLLQHGINPAAPEEIG